MCEGAGVSYSKSAVNLQPLSWELRQRGTGRFSVGGDTGANRGNKKMKYEEFKQKPLMFWVKDFLKGATICGGIFIAFGFINQKVFDGGLLISKKTRDGVKVFLKESQSVFGNETNYQTLDSSKNSNGKVYVTFYYPYDLEYFSKHYKDKLLEIGFIEKEANSYTYCRLRESLTAVKHIDWESHDTEVLLTWRSPDKDKCE